MLSYRSCKATGSKMQEGLLCFAWLVETCSVFTQTVFCWMVRKLITLKLLTFFLLSQANQPLLTVLFYLNIQKGLTNSTFNLKCAYVSALMNHLSYFPPRLEQWAQAEAHCALYGPLLVTVWRRLLFKNVGILRFIWSVTHQCSN